MHPWIGVKQKKCHSLRWWLPSNVVGCAGATPKIHDTLHRVPINISAQVFQHRWVEEAAFSWDGPLVQTIGWVQYCLHWLAVIPQGFRQGSFPTLSADAKSWSWAPLHVKQGLCQSPFPHIYMRIHVYYAEGNKAIRLVFGTITWCIAARSLNDTQRAQLIFAYRSMQYRYCTSSFMFPCHFQDRAGMSSFPVSCTNSVQQYPYRQVFF